MSVISEKKRDLLKRLELQLGILDSDFIEKFVKGSGKGGQKHSKTSNCVQLYHKPSGKRVICQKDRSREINRFIARRNIVECLAEEAGIFTRESTKTMQKIRRKKNRAKL